MLLTIVLAAAITGAGPMPAIGTATACDPRGQCRNFSQRYASLSGCQVGLMMDLASWISESGGDWRVVSPLVCIPANQSPT